MSGSTVSVKRRNPTSSEARGQDAFGAVLRQARIGRNLSQDALALQTGFDRTFIGMLERGLASPSLRTLFRLAEVLQVRPSQIIRRMEQSMVHRSAKKR
jgi:transcriptional regulator with XRE-family HTH domain